MHISIEDKPRPDDCDFVRNRLYEHNAAYEIWGELKDLPVGHRRIFLQKTN